MEKKELLQMSPLVQKIKNELLMQACQEDNLEAAGFLVKQGAEASYVDDEGYSPLWEVCNNSNIPFMWFLMKLGAHPNDGGPNTCLHAAACSPFRSLEAVELLVSCGADPNAKDSDGNTPYDRAKESDWDEDGESEITSFLKRKMAQI